MERLRPTVCAGLIAGLVFLSGCEFLNCERCTERQEAARLAALQKFEEEQRQLAAAAQSDAAEGRPVTVPPPVPPAATVSKPGPPIEGVPVPPAAQP